MNNITVSVVLPAFQEEENLEKILPRIHECFDTLGVSYEILVIDTVEPMDDTYRVCLHHYVTYCPREGGNCYGDAIRTGIEKARGKYLIIMDADGSHNPEDIRRFYEEIIKEKYDLIIGSRYCKGGSTENSFILRFMSWSLNVTYRLLFGLKVKDVSNSFRMYHTEQLKQLRLQCDILIALKHQIKDFTVKEIPVSFNKRMAGKSKRNLWKFVLSYLRTMYRLMIIKKQHSQGNNKS